MRWSSLVLAAMAVALAAAAPAPQPDPQPAPQPAPQPDPQPAPQPDPKADPLGDNTPEIIEIIAPAASAQETLSTLNLGAPGAELSERNKRTIGILRQLFPTLTQGAADENQLLSGAESQQAEVRVAFADQQAAASEPAADQQPAASDDQAAAADSVDEISLDDTDNSEENRNKRFLSFGGSSGGSSGGGGSGNFLFDIVRLVAGSSSASGGGAEAEATADGEAGKADGLTEGVPGPITRLFIIANRGIANLVQDLILRIAQTSERIVNFKARLITSII